MMGSGEGAGEGGEGGRAGPGLQATLAADSRPVPGPGPLGTEQQPAGPRSPLSRPPLKKMPAGRSPVPRTAVAGLRPAGPLPKIPAGRSPVPGPAVASLLRERTSACSARAPQLFVRAHRHSFARTQPFLHAHRNFLRAHRCFFTHALMFLVHALMLLLRAHRRFVARTVPLLLRARPSIHASALQFLVCV